MAMTPPSTTPSSPGVSHNDGNFDSKIASLRVRLREEHVARLKEAMAGSIQEECKRQDDAIKSAWEAIVKAMEEFNAHKHHLFEAMREDEGQARTQQAIDVGGLDRIMPKSYQMIVDRLALSDRADSKDSKDAPTVKSLADSRQPSPAHLVSGGSKDPLPSLTITPTSATAPPVKQFTARRTRPPQITLPQDAFVEPPSAKRVRVGADCESTKASSIKFCENRDLASWEVEGKEFIFAYPFGSPCFYVIRCESSGGQPPHLTFKTHPFGDGAPAIDHYNNAKRCKGGHNGDRSFRHDEIVKRWGFRVTGADVTEEWVKASNAQLGEMEGGGIASRTPGSKRKER